MNSLRLKQKINSRMDQLQQMMESNQHIENKLLVEMHLESVSKFWAVLSEEDRDYIQCAMDAIEDGIKWEL